MNEKAKDDKLIELLPWYVNGTLRSEERQAVEELLQRSAEARAEKAVLESLQDHVKAQWQSVEPGELGWKRLQKSLHTPPTGNAKAGTDKFWNRFIAAAAVLVICLQVGIYFKPMNQAPTQVLGGDPQVHQLDVQLFRVVIRQDARWGDIENLLFTLQAQVVEGPSALGVVTLAASKEADAQAILKQLTGASFIEHAQIIHHE